MLLRHMLDVIKQLDGMVDRESSFVVRNLGPLGVASPQFSHAIDQDLASLGFLNDDAELLPSSFL